MNIFQRFNNYITKFIPVDSLQLTLYRQKLKLYTKHFYGVTAKILSTIFFDTSVLSKVLSMLSNNRKFLKRFAFESLVLIRRRTLLEDRANSYLSVNGAPFAWGPSLIRGNTVNKAKKWIIASEVNTNHPTHYFFRSRSYRDFHTRSHWH